jgi:hypothetical protein
MNNMELEIVSELIHLGTMFQRTGSFKRSKVNLAEKASKAIKLGDEVFKISNSIQNFACTFSNMSIFT